MLQLADKGVGTIVCMHMSEELRRGVYASLEKDLRAANQKKTDEANRRDAIRERLVKASHYQLEKNDREPARLTKWGTPHIRAEIRTYGSDEVKFEFDATPEQAEQIVRILCQPPKAEEEPADTVEAVA